MALPPVGTNGIPTPPAPPTPATLPSGGGMVLHQVAPRTNPESTSHAGEAVQHPESHETTSDTTGVQSMDIDSVIGGVKSEIPAAAGMASASASPQIQTQALATREDVRGVVPAPVSKGVIPALKKSSDPGVPPPPPPPKPAAAASSPPPSSAAATSAPATSPASSPSSSSSKPPPPPPPPLASSSSSSAAPSPSATTPTNAKQDSLPKQSSVGTSRTTRPTRPATRSITSKSPRSKASTGDSSATSSKEPLKEPPASLPTVLRTKLDQISGLLQSESLAESKATLRQSYESLLATLAANETNKQSDISRMKEESTRHKKRIEKLKGEHLETRKAHANDKRRLTILRKQFDKAREERKAVAAAQAAVNAPESSDAANASADAAQQVDAAEEDDPLAKLPEDVKDWSEGDVGEWLSSFAWAKDYVQEFKESAVDGQLLFEIDAETLENDLGVTKKLHRMRLLREIKSLDVSVQDTRSDSAPSTPSAAAATPATPSAASVLASLSRSSGSSSRKRPGFARGTPLKRQKTGRGKGKLVFRWGEPVEVDAWLDVESDDRWYPASVENVRASTREVLVHFHRQTKRDDEWIDINSRRLAPYGRQTDNDAANRDSDADDSDGANAATTPTVDATPTSGGGMSDEYGGGNSNDENMSDSDIEVKSPPKAKRTTGRKVVRVRRRRPQAPRNPFDSDIRYASAFSAEPFTKIQHIFSDAELFSFMENYSQAGEKPSISVLRKQMRVGKMRARRSLNDFMEKWRNQQPLLPPKPPACAIMSGRVPEGLKSIPTNYRPPSDKRDAGTESGSDSADAIEPPHRTKPKAKPKPKPMPEAEAAPPKMAVNKRRRESAASKIAPKRAKNSKSPAKSTPSKLLKGKPPKSKGATASQEAQATPRTSKNPQRKAALKAAAAARKQLLDGNKNEEIRFWNRKKNAPAHAMWLWQSGVRDGLWQCPNSICGRILHVDRRLTHPCIRDGLVSAKLNPPRVSKKKPKKRHVVTPSSSATSSAAAALPAPPPPPPFPDVNQPSAASTAQAPAGGGGGGGSMEDDEDDQDQEERYEIEKILDYRKDGGDGTFAFQVKWRDFPDSDISWEPRENFPDDSPMLQQFLVAHDLLEQMPYMPPGGGANGGAASTPSA